jgi:hypothetical protein
VLTEELQIHILVVLWTFGCSVSSGVEQFFFYLGAEEIRKKYLLIKTT